MRAAALGTSGIEVSRVGLGTNNFGWKLDLGGARRVVDAAIDAGITFMDTADMYGRTGPGGLGSGPGSHGDSERFLGAALAGRRGRVVIATKVGNQLDGDATVARGSATYIRAAVEASLSRLGVDHVDLLYYHRPDGVTPLEETVAVLNDLAAQGKVRAVGCSNLSAAELRSVGHDIVALQNRLNLVESSDVRDVLPACLELGVAYVAHSPLAGGLLSGKYGRGRAVPAAARLATRPLASLQLFQIERLEVFARARGRSLLELAIAGLASLPGVCSVLAGATSAAQVRANAAAAEWVLSPADLLELRGFASESR